MNDPTNNNFGRPLRSASDQLAGAVDAARIPPQVFQPLPPPTGQPPFRLELDTVIGAEAVAAIEQAGALVFHAVGDTGGVKSPEPQAIVAMWMENDLASVPIDGHALADEEIHQFTRVRRHSRM